MEPILKRGLAASITFLVLALVLASGVGIASLARTEPLISNDKRQGAARATPEAAQASTQAARSARAAR